MSRRSEVRNPKTERRTKSEFRNPRLVGLEHNAQTLTTLRSEEERGHGSHWVRFRISEFGLLSDLGLRLSDFRRRLNFGVVLALAAAAVGCRRDMFQQPYSKPLESSDFFQDNHMASRPLVANTVARGHLNADDALYRGKIGTNLVETFPFPITRDVLERGRERFDIYCSPCHGRTGEGNGIVVQRGFPAPPSYHIDRLRNAPVGHFFDVITQGYGMMYSYAVRVEPDDRWAIAAYIRALQLSHEGTLANVPPTERVKLEAQK